MHGQNSNNIPERFASQFSPLSDYSELQRKEVGAVDYAKLKSKGVTLMPDDWIPRPEDITAIVVVESDAEQQRKRKILDTMPPKWACTIDTKNLKDIFNFKEMNRDMPIR